MILSIMKIGHLYDSKTLPVFALRYCRARHQTPAILILRAVGLAPNRHHGRAMTHLVDPAEADKASSKPALALSTFSVARLPYLLIGRGFLRACDPADFPRDPPRRTPDDAHRCRPVRQPPCGRFGG